MKKKLINYLGLLGIVQLLSYSAAVVFAPLAFPGYDWLSQAVSDLSADSAPSRMLWDQLSALYSVCSPVCVTCAAVYISETKPGSKAFRVGIYLFALMTWISKVGFAMFPLSDSGKEIDTFQDKMHIAVTAAVVLLSIVSLTTVIISGFRCRQRALAVCAAISLAMMFVGAVGMTAVPPELFGVVERFSVFAAVGFTAVLGIFLFAGKNKAEE